MNVFPPCRASNLRASHTKTVRNTIVRNKSRTSSSTAVREPVRVGKKITRTIFFFQRAVAFIIPRNSTVYDKPTLFFYLFVLSPHNRTCIRFCGLLRRQLFLRAGRGQLRFSQCTCVIIFENGCETTTAQWRR